MLTIGCEAAGRHCMPMDILGAMNKSPRSLKLFAAACALLVLTACGNKGPLVMPDAPAAEPAADTPATDPAQPPAGSETDGTPPATTP